MSSGSISLSLVYGTSDISIGASQSFISTLGKLMGEKLLPWICLSEKLVPEFNVSVSILLQHRGDTCSFPGLKHEQLESSISEAAGAGVSFPVFHLC